MMDIICFIICIILAVVAGEIGRATYWNEINIPIWVMPIIFIIFIILMVATFYFANRIFGIL